MTDKTNITIRPATIEDKEFILALVPRLNEFGPPAWRNSEELLAADTQILKDKLINNPEDTAIFIAEDNQQTSLGFIHLQTGHDYYYKEKHGHISDIIVTQRGEGKGTGRALIEYAEQWAKTQGYKWLTLSVFAQNVRARQMYERIGYGEDIMKYVKELE